MQKRIDERVRLWDSGRTVDRGAIVVRTRAHRIDFGGAEQLSVVRECGIFSGGPSPCNGAGGGAANAATVAATCRGMGAYYTFDTHALLASHTGDPASFWLPPLDASRTHGHTRASSAKYSVGFLTNGMLDRLASHLLTATRPVEAKVFVSNTDGGAELHIDLHHQLHVNGQTPRFLSDGNRTVKLLPGDVTVIPAGVPHAFSGQGTALTLAFTDPVVRVRGRGLEWLDQSRQ